MNVLGQLELPPGVGRWAPEHGRGRRARFPDGLAFDRKGSFTASGRAPLDFLVLEPGVGRVEAGAGHRGSLVPHQLSQALELVVARNSPSDPPTDLSLHANSPGYRLILNNVLFPAAKKRELKT